jgi:hypothetical protein
MLSLMRTPRRAISYGREDCSAVYTDQSSLRESIPSARSAELRKGESISCLRGTMTGVYRPLSGVRSAIPGVRWDMSVLINLCDTGRMDVCWR